MCYNTMVLNMKTNKLFLILSSLFISVSTLVACNTTNNAKQYYLHVDSVDSSICPDLPKSGLYNEKEKISLKVKVVTDVTFYVFLNDERLNYDRREDQIGGYEYYEFEMPSMESYLTINSDLYYQDREYDFNEVVYGVDYIINNINNITSVSIQIHNLGEDDVVVTSYDKRDIEYNVNILKNEKLVKDLMPSKSDYKHTKTISFMINDQVASLQYEPRIEYWDFSNPTFFTFANGESAFRINHPVPPSIEC